MVWGTGLPSIFVPAGVAGRRYLPHIRLPVRASAEGLR